MENVLTSLYPWAKTFFICLMLSETDLNVMEVKVQFR